MDASGTPVIDPSGTPVIDPSGTPVIDPSGITIFTLTDNSGNSYTITPTFVWDVRRMDVVPSLNGLNNVVKYIHWTYSTTVTINDNSYTAYYTDIATLLPPETLFCPYNELTKETVCGWLDNTVNLPQMRKIVVSNLQGIFAPPILSLPLPF
jgi:hypothetical protein